MSQNNCNNINIDTYHFIMYFKIFMLKIFNNF